MGTSLISRPASAALSCILLTFISSVFADDAKVDRLQLMRHSFDSPLTYDNNLGEWTFGGASVATKTHVVLLPAVANRSGNFWHKAPLKTLNFELDVEFNVVGHSDCLSNGFGIWYSYDDFAGIYPPKPEAEAQWNLFGYKNTFRGLGVFFSFSDRDNSPRSSISLSINDGNKTISMGTDVPTSDGVYFQPFRNTPQPLLFRLAVGPMGVMGRLRQIDSDVWTNCFKVPPQLILPGGHIGFSASNPERRGGASECDAVNIQSVHVYNLDVTQHGEDPGEDLAKSLQDVEVGDLLKEHGHGRGDKPDAVAAELRQLSRLLFKQIAEQQPRETIIQKQLTSQSSILHLLAQEIRELQQNIVTLTGGGGLNDAVVDQVTNELQGLRNLFHSQTVHQETLQQSLSTLQKSMGAPAELSKFAEQSAALEATIKQQAQYSSWMILIIIIMIALFALFVWKRMRDMEKKHFL